MKDLNIKLMKSNYTKLFTGSEISNHKQLLEQTNNCERPQVESWSILLFRLVPQKEFYIRSSVQFDTNFLSKNPFKL